MHIIIIVRFFERSNFLQIMYGIAKTKKTFVIIQNNFANSQSKEANGKSITYNPCVYSPSWLKKGLPPSKKY